MEKKSKVLLGLVIVLSISSISSVIAIDGENSQFVQRLLTNAPILCDDEILCEGQVAGSINMIRGEMWYHNHTATSISFDVVETYYKLFFTESYSNGVEINLTNNSMKIITPGNYKVCNVACGDGANNHEYFLTVAINSAIQEKCSSHKKMAAGGDITNMGSCCFLDVNENDIITLEIADFTSSSVGNYFHGNVNIFRVGT